MSVTLRVDRVQFSIGEEKLWGYYAPELEGTDQDNNFLSGKQLANSIGNNSSTTLIERLPKRLKALLGEGSTTLIGVYKNRSGAETKLNLWDTKGSALYWQYQARHGRDKIKEGETETPRDRAFFRMIALGGTTLDILINDERGKAYQHGFAKRRVAQIIQEAPNAYQMRFEKDWRNEAERITGWEWNWRCMAYLINLAVYDHCSPAVRKELDRVNPSQDGKRANKQHQHFTKESLPELLALINTAYDLMVVSESVEDLKENLRRRYKGVYQMSLF